MSEKLIDKRIKEIEEEIILLSNHVSGAVDEKSPQKI